MALMLKGAANNLRCRLINVRGLRPLAFCLNQTMSPKTRTIEFPIRDFSGSMDLMALPKTRGIVNDHQIRPAKAAKSLVNAVGEYQYPWQEKLAKYKNELSKGVWGYWELGAWKPLGISARRRARIRKEVLLAGEDWPYDPQRKEMRTKRKGHKCDRISAEKRAHTAELMKSMPQKLLDYKKRRWEKKMKEEDAKAAKV